MRRHWQYFRYIMRHKWFVFVAACKLGVPWLGIIHDWSKFKPTEWFPYVERFYGHNNDVAEAMQDISYQHAWNHHQKQNKHHWQYWRLVRDSGVMVLLPMPAKYRKELLADWRGAGRALGFPDTRAWYLKNRLSIQLHSETREWIEAQLGCSIMVPEA